MSERHIVGISGNLTRPSKTRALVGEILRQAEARRLGRVELLDLVDAGPELGAATGRANLPAAPDRVLTAIEQSDALVVATPVYKAAYTGLLKHLFDLIDPKLLEGRPVLLAATGASDRHALVIEHSLRPLFAFFRAHALPIGIYAVNADFTPAGNVTEGLAERIAPAVDQLEAWLGHHAKAGAGGASGVRIA